MKKKLKTLRQILSEHNYDINYDDIILYYDNGDEDNMIIAQSMKKYFGKEIEVSVYEDRWFAFGWYWMDDWFKLPVDFLEDKLFEI